MQAVHRSPLYFRARATARTLRPVLAEGFAGLLFLGCWVAGAGGLAISLALVLQP